MHPFKIHVFSHVGNLRATQEDNYLAGQYAFLTPDNRVSMSESRTLFSDVIELSVRDYCAFVCDGMGGHAHGEIASLTAVQLLQQYYDGLLQAAAVSTEAIQDIIARINEDFCYRASSSQELRTMGTTLCGVIVKDFHVFGINIGDSRLYTFKDGLLKQVTIDHTEGQRLLSLGFLTKEEVQRFPNRKAIHKHLGQRVRLMPDVFEIDNIVPGTIMLLATDGLTDALSDTEISLLLQANMHSLNACGTEIVETAVERNPGYGDNITLVLIAF